jgi:hypothetical protein
MSETSSLPDVVVSEAREEIIRHLTKKVPRHYQQVGKGIPVAAILANALRATDRG